MYILDNLDNLILQQLRTASLTATSLSLVIKEPRTTITFRLKRLESSHHITSHIVGKRVFWKLTLKRVHSKNLFAFYEGANFFECYKVLFTLRKDSVIYAVQGVGAGKAEFKNIPHYLIEEIHRLYKQRRIIMRGVTNPTLLEIFKKLTKQLQQSHKGRPQGIRVQAGLFNSTGELFVTKSFVIIVDPQKRRGLVIKEPGVVSLFYDFMLLFHTFSDQLAYLDINAHLEKD